MKTSTITLFLFQEYWYLHWMAFKFIDLGKLFYKYVQFSDLIASQYSTKIFRDKKWICSTNESRKDLLDTEIISHKYRYYITRCRKSFPKINLKKHSYNWKIRIKLIDIIMVTWWVLHLLSITSCQHIQWSIRFSVKSLNFTWR